MPHGPSNGAVSIPHLAERPSFVDHPQMHAGAHAGGGLARSSTSLMSMTQSGATVGSNRMRTEVPALGFPVVHARSFWVSSRTNSAVGSKSFPANVPG